MNLFVNRLKQVFIFLFFALIFINVNDAKADSHDQLSENLKQSLTKVINENVIENDEGFEVVQIDVEPLDVYFGRTFLVHNKGSDTDPF